MNVSRIMANVSDPKLFVLDFASHFIICENDVFCLKLRTWLSLFFKSHHSKIFQSKLFYLDNKSHFWSSFSPPKMTVLLKWRPFRNDDC